MVFVSHETYTPARGGSASAEIHALRRVFGDDADQIVIANTKGFTGHAMGTGIEDVVAVKALETGCVPPVANFKEVDPELGPLNLSKGGAYPVEYALRLGAGFGSQISMTLLRRVAVPGVARPSPHRAWATRTASPTPPPGSDGSTASPAMRRSWRSCSGRCACAMARARAFAGPPPAPSRASRRGRRLRRARSVSRSACSRARSRLRGGDPVKARVLALVVEKTGYPRDMLDLDLDLEADLGVDTVKQAEMFASIREIYNIPRDPNVKLRDFPTLARVIGFVYDRRPGPRRVAARRAAPAPRTRSRLRSPSRSASWTWSSRRPAIPGTCSISTWISRPISASTPSNRRRCSPPSARCTTSRATPNVKLRDFPTLARVIRFVYDRRPDLARRPPLLRRNLSPADRCAGTAPLPPQPTRVQEKVLAIVAEKTGYPKEMLDLDLDLEADLGIDTVKQAEMFASVRAAFGIPRDQNMKLRDFPTLAHVIQFARGRQTPAADRSHRMPQQAAPRREPRRSKPPKPSRGAFRFRNSGRRSPAANRPAYRSTAGRARRDHARQRRRRRRTRRANSRHGR